MTENKKHFQDWRSLPKSQLQFNEEHLLQTASQILLRLKLGLQLKGSPSFTAAEAKHQTKTAPLLPAESS